MKQSRSSSHSLRHIKRRLVGFGAPPKLVRPGVKQQLAGKRVEIIRSPKENRASPILVVDIVRLSDERHKQKAADNDTGHFHQHALVDDFEIRHDGIHVGAQGQMDLDV